ncbi:hypothetical protein SAMN02910298_01540 [Pseudobutyrivibrio sp. YE44]|uniref:hypothetical protein n=1 Tax=Pseudobutyrivibrio sp. YE44 TaxID=1520802 RepID=UPI000886D208|nr:hypothetical protein [Pseudobutyrivibrio sp. YE44]SDB31128.1 hypothetical protein SAMN02910298_01540 [Pseudobutyrivibrio sp. YE44]
MCEAVQKYAEEYAKEHTLDSVAVNVKNLMTNMNWSMEQALDALGIEGDERAAIMEKLAQ